MARLKNTKPLGVGEFIYSQLCEGADWWGYDLYSAYKEAAQSIPRFHIRDRIVIKGVRERGLIKQIDWDHRTVTVISAKVERTIPFSDIKPKRGKRKVCSYHSFLTYLYMLRSLGLIEYVMEDGEIAGDEPLDKGGNPAPQLSKTHKFHISEIGNPTEIPGAWSDFQKAYRESSENFDDEEDEDDEGD